MLSQYIYSCQEFGWPAYLYVLKEEKVYLELCNQTEIEIQNATSCFEQDAKFQSMFILGCLLANIFGTVFGLILDSYGVFTTRILAGIPLTSSLIFLIFYENRWLLDVGCYLLGVCALGGLLTNLSLQAIWPKRTSTIGSIFSGTFDGSASTFMLVKGKTNHHHELFFIISISFVSEIRNSIAYIINFSSCNEHYCLD